MVSLVSVSVWCDYIGGTRGSGVVSSADVVLEMSVVRGVRGVGEVCTNNNIYLKSDVHRRTSSVHYIINAFTIINSDHIINNNNIYIYSQHPRIMYVFYSGWG